VAVCVALAAWLCEGGRGGVVPRPPAEKYVVPRGLKCKEKASTYRLVPGGGAARGPGPGGGSGWAKGITHDSALLPWLCIRSAALRPVHLIVGNPIGVRLDPESDPVEIRPVSGVQLSVCARKVELEQCQ
jgi:hypothetical protein